MRRSKGVLVRLFPQVQIGHKSPFAQTLETVSSSSSSSASPVDDIADLRKRLDWRLWNAIAEKDWNRWESVIDLYKQHSLPLDEVSYSLVMHGYLLSHHHPASVALMVLEGMKQDDIHPAIVKLNETLLNTYFELSDLGIRSSANGWQNLARLTWMSAARLRKKRMQRVRHHLQSLPTSEVLKLTSADVQRLISAEHALAQVIADDPMTGIESPDEDQDLLDH
jgi:hypothetical protein